MVTRRFVVDVRVLVGVEIMRLSRLLTFLVAEATHELDNVDDREFVLDDTRNSHAILDRLDSSVLKRRLGPPTEVRRAVPEAQSAVQPRMHVAIITATCQSATAPRE